ncbi:hypothetical protein HUJ05_002086 [Dendroctonus ponderosae]|nr:hypothetical protein HUJ05_002086 [Dendroctonus ponderosae]
MVEKASACHPSSNPGEDVIIFPRLENIGSRPEQQQKSTIGKHLDNGPPYNLDVQLANNAEHLEKMITDLNQKSRKIGLNINMNKTKTMCPVDPNIIIDNNKIENVKDYTYLGQRITLGKENKDIDIEARIIVGWTAFGKTEECIHYQKNTLASAIKSLLPMRIARTRYGAQTSTFTGQMMNKLSVNEKRNKKRNELRRSLK